MGNAGACCASSTSTEKPEVAVATPGPAGPAGQPAPPEPQSGAPTEEQTKSASASATDPAGPKRVVLRFVLPDGGTQDIEFENKPLGIDFSRSLPLTCKRLKPGMQGEQKEVKIGWCVTHINDTPVPVTGIQCEDELYRWYMQHEDEPGGENDDSCAKVDPEDDVEEVDPAPRRRTKTSAASQEKTGAKRNDAAKVLAAKAQAAASSEWPEKRARSQDVVQALQKVLHPRCRERDPDMEDDSCNDGPEDDEALGEGSESTSLVAKNKQQSENRFREMRTADYGTLEWGLEREKMGGKKWTSGVLNPDPGSHREKEGLDWPLISAREGAHSDRAVETRGVTAERLGEECTFAHCREELRSLRPKRHPHGPGPHGAGGALQSAAAAAPSASTSASNSNLLMTVPKTRFPGKEDGTPEVTEDSEASEAEPSFTVVEFESVEQVCGYLLEEDTLPSLRTRNLLFEL
ncbi:unnamed protein product [Symbiodinium sp. CCMP2592]|nr:unnamed protein product [Symbiodinium sp. CCMP2592]